MPNNKLAAYLNFLIQNDKIINFYHSRYWQAKRKEVLVLDHHECQDCKDRGILTKAILVHHVNEVKVHPELALSIYFMNEKGVKERNLISLCFNCHELRHNRCFKIKKKEEKYQNDEWW